MVGASGRHCAARSGRLRQPRRPGVQDHSGVGGAGTAACSGDLLLGALAACAQLTRQMVAAALAVPVEGIEVTVEGDLDLRGTLGVVKDMPAGFQAIPAGLQRPGS
jgi:OsmC-like protein